MALVLIAIGDPLIREATRRYLEQLGHGVVLIRRPLAALAVSKKVRWEVAFVDDTPLGRDALAVLTGQDIGKAMLVGLGFEDKRLHVSVPFPLYEGAAPDLADLVAGRPVAPRSGEGLTLDSQRRLAVANGREVALTRTEFRLLEVLLERQPREVPLPEVLQLVWGFTEGRGTSELVRAHVRNLRLKLDHIGLADAIRSRRGRGYALVL